MERIKEILVYAVQAFTSGALPIAHWLGENWDKAINSASAAIVAFVALYGYFYTIVPIYAKAQLEEQKAQLEKDVVGIRENVAALEVTRDKLLSERDKLSTELGTLAAEQTKIRNDNEALTRQLAYNIQLIERHNYYVNRPHVVREWLSRITTTAIGLLNTARQTVAAWNSGASAAGPLIGIDHPYLVVTHRAGYVSPDHNSTGADVFRDALQKSELAALLTESDRQYLTSRTDDFIEVYTRDIDPKAFTTPLFTPMPDDARQNRNRADEYLRNHNEAHAKFAAALQQFFDTLPMTFTGGETPPEELSPSGGLKEPVPNARPGRR